MQLLTSLLQGCDSPSLLHRPSLPQGPPTGQALSLPALLLLAPRALVSLPAPGDPPAAVHLDISPLLPGSLLWDWPDVQEPLLCLQPWQEEGGPALLHPAPSCQPHKGRTQPHLQLSSPVTAAGRGAAAIPGVPAAVSCGQLLHQL